MSAPCTRPECGGEVHTDGWGTPVRCPHEQAEQTLHAKKTPVLVHACESGRHREHPGLDCDEADQWIAHEEAVWKKHWGRQYAAALQTPMCDVPPALRGPNWKGRP